MSYIPRIKVTAICGDVIEISEHVSTRFGKKINRSKNKDITPEEQARVNARNAEKNVRQLIFTNFKEGDIHETLTYRGSPPSEEEAKKCLAKFFRKARQYYKQQNLEMKYICVTESEGKRIHHHIVMNSIDPRLIQKAWEHGTARATIMYETETFPKLSNYLIKETKDRTDEEGRTKRRWSSSRNLKKPIIKREIVEAKTWRKEPKPYKGYYIDKSSIKNGVHEMTGYAYRFYRMIRIKVPEPKKGKVKRE